MNQKFGSIQAPDLRALLDNLSQEISYGLNCHQIGTIESFDSSKQIATVALNLRRYFGNEIKEYPLLLDVPVFVYSGGIGHISMPVMPGDTCLVLFNDRAIDTWWSTGSTSSPPPSSRSHDLSDGLALVGFRSLANKVSNYDLASIEIRHPNIKATGNVSVSTGATGSFTSVDGALVTVIDGIVTNIER